jgi:hypothetical protein
MRNQPILLSDLLKIIRMLPEKAPFSPKDGETELLFISNQTWTDSLTKEKRSILFQSKEARLIEGSEEKSIHMWTTFLTIAIDEKGLKEIQNVDPNLHKEKS